MIYKTVIILSENLHKTVELEWNEVLICRHESSPFGMHHSVAPLWARQRPIATRTGPTDHSPNSSNSPNSPNSPTLAQLAQSTTNPLQNHSIFVDCPPADATDAATEAYPSLEVSIFDYDLVGADDFMGR